MFSFSNLLRRCFGLATKHTAKRQPIGRWCSIRLGVETLESRDLMSATVPGFTLSGGNLYNTAISQQQPIDTGVKSFAVVNSTVYVAQQWFR